MNNSTCDDEGITDIARRQILIARGLTGSISFILCIVALVLLVIFQVRRYVETSITQRLIVYLIFATIARSITVALQSTGIKFDEDDSNLYLQLCMAIGFFGHWTAWIVLMNIQIIVLHVLVDLYYPFYRQRKLYQAIREFFYVIIPILLPLLFSWIPFIHDAYGLAGAWCWIRKEDNNCNEYLDGLIEQYVLWYVPSFLFQIIDCFGFFLAYPFIVIHKIEDKGDRKALLKQHAPLLVFIGIFVILNWIGLANRIHRIVHPVESTHLWIFHAIASSSWGCLAGMSFIGYLIILFSLHHKQSGYNKINE